mmetsp:Transcript_12524/g.15732  ORF Transcript_12524/g.15732 Transcript_12524/m.15732 type:complete len:96 (+) Transcript_12524:39-326(+)
MMGYSDSKIKNAKQLSFGTVHYWASVQSFFTGLMTSTCPVNPAGSMTVSPATQRREEPLLESVMKRTPSSMWKKLRLLLLAMGNEQGSSQVQTPT